MTIIEAIREARLDRFNFIAIDKDKACYGYDKEPKVHGTLSCFDLDGRTNISKHLGFINTFEGDWEKSLIKLNEVLVK